MKKISITISIAAVCLLIGAGIHIRAQEQKDSKEPVVIENTVKKITTAARANDAIAVDLFEEAVAIIKKYEGSHQANIWPFVGYGHKVQPGEKYTRNTVLSEKKADELLRKDLLKNCAQFREFGADSLLLGTLAYNIGSGNVKRSSVTRALRNGNRDIRDLYLSHCRYRGKRLSQLQRRRVEEFDRLYIEDIESLNDSTADAHAVLDSRKTLTSPEFSLNSKSMVASVRLF